MPPMLAAAGWREREILKNAISFNLEYTGLSNLIYFYTKDTGVTAGGVYDEIQNVWRG